MSNLQNMICPTCKQLTQQADNEIIEYLAKEKDRYRALLGERTEELIRTRKALDVAVDALKKYTDASGNWWYGYEFQGHYEDYAGEYADKALEQITALEQKDVK